MNQLKPMIIVLLMLTSALAGCAGNDTKNIIGPYADLTGADLTGTNLTGANLSGADLTDANLSGANLDYVRAINLLECPSYLPADWMCENNNLVGPLARLQEADLSGAYLTGATLHDADLRYADLSGADLIDAFLYNADLIGANLSNADLTNADLSYADLSDANLSGADHLSDVFWHSTTCPDGTNSDDNGYTCENNL